LKFSAHKLPAGVIANLPSQIAALESAMAGQTDSRRAHKVARRVADAELKSGSQAMDALERIYMNASGGNTGAVNDWKEARRVGPSRTVVPPAAVATPAATPALPTHVA